MEAFENVLLNASQFIKGRLFFVSLNTDVKPKSTTSVHYFSIDNELSYDSFYLDFGPLNLAMLYHYCSKLKRKLISPGFANKKIVHYTGTDTHKRVNAAFLIGSYSIIYLDFTPEEAYKVLNNDSTRDYTEFRDASIGDPYTLGLLDCLKAIKKAKTYGFFDFRNFDFLEYEHYERVENGDFNWIVPNKFIAFCGPHNRSKLDMGYPIHSPETYFAYFRRHKISTIIRLNKKAYDCIKFVNAGFDHRDLYFVDGGTPSDRILQQFINICETAKGAVAVHCKAGLGRTGSLIACYIMKHWKFTAEETIAWIRICRPGSIIGHQQSWLKEKQAQMWYDGEIFRKKHKISSPQKFAVGIYGTLPDVKSRKNNDNVNGILKKVDCMEIKDNVTEDKNGNSFLEEIETPTQGDKLNEIKAQRSKLKVVGSTPSERLRRVHVTTTTSASMNHTVLRGGKVINNSQVAGSTSTRVVTKRVEKEAPAKRATTRKIATSMSDKSATQNELPKSTPKITNLRLVTKTKTNGLNGNCVKQEKSVKRTKRALALEKDKSASPRSVKVLRRSHALGLSFKDEAFDCAKLFLPSVKLNKTI